MLLHFIWYIFSNIFQSAIQDGAKFVERFRFHIIISLKAANSFTINTTFLSQPVCYGRQKMRIHRPSSQESSLGLQRNRWRLPSIKSSIKRSNYLHGLSRGNEFSLRHGIGCRYLSSAVCSGFAREKSRAETPLYFALQNTSGQMPPVQQKRYYAILQQADSTVYTSRTYYPNCMLNRNRFLIEHADIVLVVYNDKPQSGTGATVRYAQQPGRKVIVINPLPGST